MHKAFNLYISCQIINTPNIAKMFKLKVFPETQSKILVVILSLNFRKLHIQHIIHMINILFSKGRNKEIKKKAIQERMILINVNIKTYSFMSSTMGNLW